MASSSFSSSRAVDVQFALQRVKRKINNLQQQLSNKETGSESLLTWTLSKELWDSLVDMYPDNPRVNVELRRRLPSPDLHLSDLHLSDRPGTNRSSENSEAPLHLQQPLSSCSPSPLPHSRRSVSSLSSRPSRGAGGMEMDLSPSRGPSPRAQSSRDDKGGGSPVLRGQVGTCDRSFHLDVSTNRRPILDRDQNVSFLLKELDNLRHINHKLLEQLVQKEEELQRRQVEEELREELTEARGWERPSEVLEEVLVAQKDRDQALMSRLLLANEERDEALLRARQLQQAAESEKLKLDDTDMDVDEVLQCVCDADSVQQIEQFGSLLVQRLRLAQHRRNDITAQEMKAVMEERDGSVAKCKHLEQDLIQEREQRTNKEALLRLQRERDSALDHRQRLEAELQALRANHSPQDLLYPPSNSRGSLSEPPPLLVQLQQLSKEKESVEAELQRCQEAEREAGERVRRLERLVEVLRKKVGTGSLRAVV
ncbi:mirror-image polydactyly gene 1 protein isoform X5 [Scophthalmus maximus]|nr:mirror-image polydactyly gene 1 protein isoform X5 [Scophthalmus maximus]